MKINYFYQFLNIAFQNKKEKKLLLSFLIVLGSLIAALLEGGSYCMLFFALGAMSHTDIASNALVSFFLSKEVFFNHSFSFFITLALTLQLAKALVCFFCNAGMTNLSAQVELDLQNGIYQRILKMNFPNVNRYTNGELVEFVRNPSHYTRIFFENFNHVVLFSFMIIISYILLLMISTPLALFTLALFTLAFFFQRYFLKMSHKVSQSLTKEMEKFADHSVENFQGIRVLHLYNIQNRALNKIMSLLKNFSKLAKRQGLWIGLSAFIHEIFSISLVGISLLVGYFLLSQESNNPLPALLGFITITYRLTQKGQVLIQALSHIARQQGMVDQTMKILEGREETTNIDQKKVFSSFEKSIAFKDVSFGYTPFGATLNSLSFSFSKGDVVAIVGPSGAGKSTLLDLLSGLYCPSKGSIFVDGKELKNYEINSWRKKIGIVSQELFLFQDSILENIRLGKENSSREEAIVAAKKAGAYSFIAQLPHGFDTIIGENGYRLSQGEKQRVSLARALIRDAEILLLDEATSHLDSSSESLISDTLVKYRREKTIIAVAHRLTTVAHADSILVLDNGTLKEVGTHEQLLKKEAIYAALWKTQSYNPINKE